ncbi:MAG: glycosyl hydrolase family 28 protein [Candidatus Acidiferrum sp.]
MVFALAAAGGGNAQDRRNVMQPKIPPACVTLIAGLTAVANNSTLAEADEQNPDTARIQQALDVCPAGRAVELKAGSAHNAFLSGPLHLRFDVTLLVDVNTILFASRNPRDYDVAPGACGIVDRNGHGCKALINADHVANASVMGDGTIDGRGWAKLVGQKESWWELAEDAREGNRSQNCPRLFQITDSGNFTLFLITLKNAANFHVAFTGGTGFTAWGVVIDTPKTARNTDGIDPISATDVTITRSYIHAGDDNVAIKAGDAGPSSHITISHDHFYAGHGMSIGSETNGGVSAVRVSDLSIDGADNGIRIKSNASRGGLVRDVSYSDVCIRDTNNPILMDTHYSFYGSAKDLLPDFTEIVLHDVRASGGGKVTLDGYDASHRLGIQFDNVILDAPSLIKLLANHADILIGPGPVNFRPSGIDVHLTEKDGSATPNACQNKFVPLPKK